MKKFWKDLFSNERAVSSKRVSGFLGWIVCLGVCIYCTITNKEAASIVDTLFYCSSALLGIETVTEIWKK